ncbi:MAG: beta-galactosidase [Ignavibacteriaceae bacterium]|nr:beta-galactosidase [Ignavibacteriaceae bacterium]
MSKQPFDVQIYSPNQPIYKPDYLLNLQHQNREIVMPNIIKNYTCRIVTFLFIAINISLYGQVKLPPVIDSLSFPVMTWYGLTPEQLDTAHFKELADAGFTINFSDLRTPELNKKALELAQQYGIKLIINDKRIQPDKPVDSAAIAKLDQVVKDYSGSPALLGYFIVDESGAENFENMALIKKELCLKDPRHLVYANLLPDYATAKQTGTNTYGEYIDKYMKIFQPQFISYDYYPFVKSGFKDTYYQNLGTIREAALKAGVPFWSFAMSCQIKPAFPLPRESWIRLQLFSGLAYGAKGLQYFTYSLPPRDTVGPEEFITSILDSRGKATYLYDIAERVNSEIHSLEGVLKQLKSIGVYHTGNLPKGTEPLPEDFYINKITGGDMVAGYFKDKSGHPYLLLVNRNYERKLNFTISVSKLVKGFMEVSKSGSNDPVEYKEKNGKIELQFNKGDGRLFRIVE